MADNPTVVKPQESKKRRQRKKKADKGPGLTQSNAHLFKQEPSRAGILVTDKFSQAIARCKARVEDIAAECRSINRKFRDPEFDLEGNKNLCLHSLVLDDEEQETFSPADVLRVSQIFDNPQFIVDEAESSDIAQGQLGDCWLLSALAMLTSLPGLAEKICVARDEKVGIYGFIFCRDGEWVDVIIDDQLCTTVAKYETLSGAEKNLYHHDKDLFEKVARKGSKTLLFSRSVQENETWVPLLEKAYAKFHGDYASLSGGYACEALEDLTGGVSETLYTNDILDPDEFWHTNLTRVTKDRLFGCYRYIPNGEGGTDGLYSQHAYSILAAIEYNGKRFVKVRNPWGCGEWNGRWSDGSKEWTEEWRPVLLLLHHQPGEDGEFIMEYGDFLNTWQFLERVQLFDDSWIQSSHWLNVKTRPFPSLWQYGDVSFTFTIDGNSPAMIVLSQADARFWDALKGLYEWSFDFLLYKRGQEKIIARSRVAPNTRSVSVSKDLEAGEYFVHVRLDRTEIRDDDYFEENSKNWPGEKLIRIKSEYAKSQSMAANYNSSFSKNMVVPEELFAKGNLLQLEMGSYQEVVSKRQSRNAIVFPTPRPRTADGEESKDDDKRGTSNEKALPANKYAKKGSGVKSGDRPARGYKKEKISVDEDNNKDDNRETKKESAEEEKNGNGNGGEGKKFKKQEQEEAEHGDEEQEKKDQETEEEEEEDDDDLSRSDIHPHIACNGCKMRHIVGIRWKCADCEGYNLCEDCYSKNVRTDNHKTSHRMIRLETRDSSEEDLSRVCDGCAVYPIVGLLWRCLLCSEFDLCDACYSKGVHPAEHPMVKAENQGDVAILADEADEDESNNNNVLLGLRVFTKSHAKVNISGQLRHGNMLSWGELDRGGDLTVA
ncbi:hypothetical protein BU17DRAFT_85000 [Hysterangium stoloniferum]|nr:hypothetical protein BU17DRAFT_85000 [Hysterangium stoloniferum]